MNFPLFDPLVAAHFQNPASNTETLIDEIYNKEIYKPLFEGKKDLTFLDIGANIGLVSLYAEPYCARIVALEPAVATFNVLKAMTFSKPKIECVQAALAPVDGPCEFFENFENTTASSVVNTFGNFTQVEGLSLSSILRIYQLECVDVCKVDCEGYEDQSLTYDELVKCKSTIGNWWIECHSYPRVNWEDVQKRIAADLEKVGYTVRTSGMVIKAIQ